MTHICLSVYVSSNHRARIPFDIRNHTFDGSIQFFESTSILDPPLHKLYVALFRRLSSFDINKFGEFFEN